MFHDIILPVDDTKSFRATEMKNPATPMELTTMKIQKTLPMKPEVLGTNRQPCKLVLPQNSLKFMVVAKGCNYTGKLPIFVLLVQTGCHCFKISIIIFSWHLYFDIYQI